MPEITDQRPPLKQIGMTGRISRGIIWRAAIWGEFKWGEPWGEWAYLTPTFPEGIRISQLKEASPDVQRETAHYWFRTNLKPYDLTGGHYFSLDVPGKGFGEAPWAPAPLSAATALEIEFEGIMQPQVMSELADVLGNQWMWIDDLSTPPVKQPVTKAEVAAAFNHLGDLLREFVPVHGGMGHNGPPDDLPLTADEHTRALHDIRSFEEALEAGDEEAARSFGKRVWETACSVGKWALKQAANEAIKETVKWAFQYYGLTARAFELLKDLLH